ncbi:MAG: hypothetical protein P8I03_13120 [Thalassotalea sp.]|nr:hypothetical protein [Thalassotalea sp.]
MEKVFGFVGNITLLLAVAFVAVIIPAYGVEYFFIDSLIQHDLVNSSSGYWKGLLQILGIVLVPPIFMFAYSMIPDQEQEAIKIGIVVLGDLASWVGKGVLFAMGAFAFLSFI